ncbi:MAG: hypothetical protein ACI37Z_02205 [Candidatus Gastranaerophilaceae bacterium]
MKKILFTALCTAIICSNTALASEYTYPQAKYFTQDKDYITLHKNDNSNKVEVVFNNNSSEKVTKTPTNISSGTTSVEKTVIPQKIVTKEIKQKYKQITKEQKLIEASELLKGTAGSFSYRSIHGNNKTLQPIIIKFTDFSKIEGRSNTDAYGEFVGKKYQININSEFKDAPSAAITPLLAREALISKDKSDSDIDAAEQLQIAVWSQMLKKNPTLQNSKNKLVILQNKLKASGNLEEYGAFLKEASAPKTKNSVPTKEITRTFGKIGSPMQKDFDEKLKSEGEKIDKEILSYDTKELQKKYKKVTKEERIIEAIELLKDTIGKFSHDAILGKNLTHKPMVIKFRNLGEINPNYETFDALGWRQAGKLNIYINHKHADAPAAALAALLAHEALHQDEFDSLNEETYAWTMEASVWTQLCDKNPSASEISHPLVVRENLLKKLLEKGDYTNKYIKKSVFSNPSYANLPVRSPGFEDDI